MPGEERLPNRHERGATFRAHFAHFAESLAVFAVKLFTAKVAKVAKKIYCRYFFPAIACRHFP